jgi:hypothetical protein
MVSEQQRRNPFVAAVFAISLTGGQQAATPMAEAPPVDSTLAQACQTDPRPLSKGERHLRRGTEDRQRSSLALMPDALNESLRTIQIVDAKTLQGVPLPKIVQRADQSQQGSTSKLHVNPKC